MALLMTSEPSQSTGRREQVTEHGAQEQHVRAKLTRLGGELKPIRRAPRTPATEAELWRIPSITRNVRVDVKAAPVANADWAAQGLARALESCGFTTKVFVDVDCTWDGVHVESRPDQAAAALLIQGAFKTAGFGAGLTIHDRAAARRVIVHVGPG